MIRAWRIVDAARIANAFTGDGPRLFGGRWSSPGVRVVYTSENVALATLEVLVHLRRMASLQQFAVIGCEFDEKLVETVKHVPPNWRDYPPAPELQAIGDAWVKDAKTPVLRVPSVIVPGENNYLLNPAHRKFRRIRIGKPERFALDARLMMN